MRTRNLHIYPSVYKFETRISKEVNSIIEMKLADEVIIAGIWAPGLPEKEQASDTIRIIRIKSFADRFRKSTIAKIFATILFNIKAYFLFRKCSLHYINCHSLWVLPLCVAIKKATGARLIYDAHELETEREGLSGLRQRFARMLEKKLIHYADSIIVVGNFIADWYKKTYGIANVYVIRNIPLKQYGISKRTSLLKDKFGIAGNEILFIYQGVLSGARGIDLLLEVFAKVPSSRHIVFMGYGPSEEKIRIAASQYANIHFQTAVPLNELTAYTSSADIGIVFIDKKTSLSYEYSLPNKFFEYIYSGIPMLISKFPEMKQLIDKYNCGWQVANNGTALAEFVNAIKIEKIKEKHPDIETFSKDLNWENEAQQLKHIYS